MKRAFAGLGLAVVLTALVGTSVLAGVDKKIHTEQARATATHHEDWDNRVQVSARSDGLVTAFITDGGTETRCRTYDGRVKVSPGRARVKATLEDCWMGTGPITVDLTWKPIAPPARIHSEEWNPTRGCGNPPLGWTAHYVLNSSQTDAATSGFIDGEPFEGYSPFGPWANRIDVSKNRMTCCGDCPVDWPT